MTLRRKLLVLNALLFVGLLALVGAALAGLLGEREHVRASLGEYDLMKSVESSQYHLLNGRVMLRDAQASAAAPEFRAAWEDLRTYKALLSGYARTLPVEINDTLQADARARTRDTSAKLAALVHAAEAHGDAGDLAARADDAARDVAGLLRVCTSFINRTDLTSARDVHRATWGVGVLAALILLVAGGVSVWQYRRIALPLRRLRDSSRKLAAGDFTARCAPQGDREFADLGADFNHMADELAAFYGQLEKMVADKSRELVRAERLASVGYLAAGVAHEINNPLNIVSAHAELSLKQLRRSPDAQHVANAVQALAIIREEAFRCKEITAKLLSLVKGGGAAASREGVSLTRCASDVAVMVRALKTFQGRALNVAIDPAQLLEVTANATEMKQVMLNLIVNALEAVKPGVGEVTVDGRCDGDAVELVVRDNGRGMDARAVERVFEPFYTDKRGAGEPGTGLGLSITHAIVTDHGGSINARSAGPGSGSEFVVRFPARPVMAGTSQRAPAGSRGRPLWSPPPLAGEG